MVAKAAETTEATTAARQEVARGTVRKVAIPEATAEETMAGGAAFHLRAPT
jgi:hypothetical protein